MLGGQIQRWQQEVVNKRWILQEATRSFDVFHESFVHVSRAHPRAMGAVRWVPVLVFDIFYFKIRSRVFIRAFLFAKMGNVYVSSVVVKFHDVSLCHVTRLCTSGGYQSILNARLFVPATHVLDNLYLHIHCVLNTFITLCLLLKWETHSFVPRRAKCIHTACAFCWTVLAFYNINLNTLKMAICKLKRIFLIIAIKKSGNNFNDWYLRFYRISLSGKYSTKFYTRTASLNIKKKWDPHLLF